MDAIIILNGSAHLYILLIVALIVRIVICLAAAICFALLIKYNLSKYLTPGLWRLLLVLGILGSITWVILTRLGWMKFDILTSIFIDIGAVAIWTIVITVILLIRAGFIKSKK